ncbi:cellulose binding domain-containing protein [Paenibacillus sp. NPDC057967]|uniref:cellulose binding domain-containing protein n=1 Tax=Paenibacillus sp. NPDC057967 TaxID=3346293 RepID=UPI0036D86651
MKVNKFWAKGINWTLIIALIWSIAPGSIVTAQGGLQASGNPKFIQLLPSVFNPSAGESTTIRWNWEIDHITAIEIRDGERLIETLTTQKYAGGYVVHNYQWNGKDKSGKVLPAGTYTIVVRPTEPKYEKWAHAASITIVDGDADKVYVAPNDDKRSNQFVVYGLNGSNNGVKNVQLTVTNIESGQATSLEATLQANQWFANVTLPPYKQMKLEAVFTGGTIDKAHTVIVNHRFRLFDDMRLLALQYFNDDNLVEKIRKDNKLPEGELNPSGLFGRSILVYEPLEIVPIAQEIDPLSNTHGVLDGYEGLTLLSPANMSTGNHVGLAVDVLIDGAAPLFFNRFYNSRSDTISEFGIHWNHTYSYRLRDLGEQVVIMFEDGHTENFTATGGGSYTKAEGRNHVLTKQSDGTYQLSIDGMTFLYFNGQGLLTRVADLNHVQTVLHYDGTKLSRVEKNGKSIQFHYNDKGQLMSVTAPGQNAAQYSYQSQQLNKVALDEQDWLYNYDAGKRLSSIIKPSGETLRAFVYDSQGRLIKETNGNGHSSTLSYDDYERKIILSNPKNEQTTYYYDKDYRLVKMQDKTGTKTYQHTNASAVSSVAFLASTSDNVAQGASAQISKKQEVRTLGVSTSASSGVLKVQMYNVSDLGKQDPTNTIHPMMRIYNTSQGTIDLRDVTVRYYFTNDGITEQVYWCDWSDIDCSKVKGSFLSVVNKGDTALEVAFTSDAGELKPGEYVEVHNRFNSKDWSDYDPTNDYSYNAVDNSFVDWNKVDAFYRGVLVWGDGSEGGTPEPTLPPGPTPDPGSPSPTPDPGAFPSPTPIPTPVPTPEPEPDPEKVAYIEASDNGTRSIRAEMFNFNRSANYNTIYPWYRLVNESDEAISLKDIRIRYFLTADTTEELIFWCDWASISSGSKVKGTFMKVSNGDGVVDTILEMSFTDQNAVLKPGQSIELHTRIGKKTWPDFKQTNDFSFNPKSTQYEPWKRIAVFVNGRFVWGQVPVGAADIAPPEEEPLYVPNDFSKSKAILITDQLGNKISYVYDVNGNLTEMTDALGQTLVWTYNGRSQVISHTDPEGRQMSYTYDGRGNLTSVTDGEGHVTSYQYNALGLPTSVILPDGSKIQVLYDGSGNPIEFMDADGSIYKQTFDESNKLLKRIDPLGQEIKLRYNTQGQVDCVEHTDGTSVSYQYNKDGEMVAFVDRNGGITRSEYDAAGLNTAIVDALGQRTSYIYDELGLLVETVDPLGNSEKIVRDGFGQITARINKLNQKTEYKYDALGQLLSTTDPAGKTTRYEYDPIGQVKRQILADGSVSSYSYDGSGLIVEQNDQSAITRYEYDERGALIKETNALGYSISRVYNANGLVEKVFNASGHETSYEYDASGRLSKSINARSQATTYERDKLGRTLAVTDPSGMVTRYVYNDSGQVAGVVNAEGHATEYQYDALGRKLSERDPRGNITRYDYDALGQLTSVTDTWGTKAIYRYDAAGNLVKQVRQDASGVKEQITSYTYNAIGQRLTMTNPLGSVTKYAYYGTGALASMTDEDSYITSYAYDEMGRRTAIDYNGVSSETFRYDEKGRLVETVDASGKTTYAYDVLGQLLTSTNPNGKAVNYTWTPTGRKASVAYPGGNKFYYEYNELDQIIKVTGPKDMSAEYRYDANGNVSEKYSADGVTTSYNYTTLGQLELLKEQLPSGELLRSITYSYDAAGNIVKQDEKARGSARNRQYAYDGLNQLVEATDQGVKTSYAYDAFGNRTQMQEGSSSPVRYEYNGANELLKRTQGMDVTAYSYDKRGNLVEEKRNSVTAAAYTFNEANRLIELKKNGLTTTYSYNVDGHRTGKSTGADHFVYLLDPLSHYGEVLETYRNGIQTDTIVYGEDRLGVVNEYGDFYGYSLDHLGSVLELRDSDGTAAESYKYDAYGRLLAEPIGDSVVKTHLSYTGHEYDPESHLYYAKARYLDAELGRFVSEDTYEGEFDILLSLNLYTYVHNNPLKYADPTGHKVWLIHGTFSDPDTWGKETGDFVNYIELLFEEPVERLKWNGENKEDERSKEAKRLTENIYKYHKKKENSGEPIRLVGHSHGGNVAILITNLLADKGLSVETLITIATPVREYQLETTVRQRINVYNEYDDVQISGGRKGNLLIANRQFNDAENVLVTMPAYRRNTWYGVSNHSYMHSNKKVWKEYIEPALGISSKGKGSKGSF